MQARMCAYIIYYISFFVYNEGSSKSFLSSLSIKGVFRKPTSPPLNLKFFLKSTRPSFFDKAGCTRQFESELSLRSFAPLFPIKEGSTSHLGLLPSGEKRKPPYSVLKPLRYKGGGPSEVYASSKLQFFVRDEPPC